MATTTALETCFSMTSMKVVYFVDVVAREMMTSSTRFEFFVVAAVAVVAKGSLLVTDKVVSCLLYLQK